MGSSFAKATADEDGLSRTRLAGEAGRTIKSLARYGLNHLQRPICVHLLFIRVYLWFYGRSVSSSGLIIVPDIDAMVIVSEGVGVGVGEPVGLGETTGVPVAVGLGLTVGEGEG